MTLHSLLFDLDGTLVNLEPLHYQAHAHTMSHHGIDLTLASYKSHVVGHSNQAMLSHFFPAWTDADKQRYSASKEAYYRSLVGDITPTPGARRLLDWAVSRSLGLALVTNATRDNVDLLLARLGLTDYFPVVVLGEELPRSKPDPLPYRVALEQLGCPPHQALVFEDSGPGIRSSKAAGLFTVGITSGLSVDELRDHGADLTIPDFETPELWRHLEAPGANTGANPRQRCVLISGGSGGIGNSIARGLVDAGMRVGIIARRVPDEWSDSAPDAWNPARDLIHADLRDASRTLHALEHWLQDIDGALDAFIHSAVSYGSTRRRPLSEIGLHEWDDVFAVNVRALYYLVHRLLPVLHKRPEALILGISSEVALHTAPGRIDYGASKAAAHQCLQSLCEELDHGSDPSVRVVQLLPQGMVNTPGIRKRRSASDSLEGYASPNSFIPAAVHLVQSLGAGYNGQRLVIDAQGGMRPLHAGALPSHSRPLGRSTSS
jgi:HAD superfamily hydrolase (TIGR01509 family)